MNSNVQKLASFCTFIHYGGGLVLRQVSLCKQRALIHNESNVIIVKWAWKEMHDEQNNKSLSKSLYFMFGIVPKNHWFALFDSILMEDALISILTIYVRTSSVLLM